MLLLLYCHVDHCSSQLNWYVAIALHVSICMCTFDAPDCPGNDDKKVIYFCARSVTAEVTLIFHLLSGVWESSTKEQMQ